jgi:hypothetical protein
MRKNVAHLYRGMNVKVYHTRTNLEKGENDNVLADFHNTLNGQRNYVSYVLVLLRGLVETCGWKRTADLSCGCNFR